MVREDRAMAWVAVTVTHVGSAFPRLRHLAVTHKRVPWDQVHVFRIAKARFRSIEPYGRITPWSTQAPGRPDHGKFDPQRDSRGLRRQVALGTRRWRGSLPRWNDPP